MRARVRVAVVLACLALIGVNGGPAAAPADAGAWDATLVRDINPGTGDGPGMHVTASDGRLWMPADDGVHGVELWVSDGTTAGTSLVKDINPGPGDSLGEFQLQVVELSDDSVLFDAKEPAHGWELWRSDGTPSGTVLVKDIWTGESSSNIAALTSHGEIAYFVANDRTHGEELWRSDGTAAGTYLVKDLDTTPDEWHPEINRGAKPSRLVSHGAYLYFFTETWGPDGKLAAQSLWRTDGTDGGTIKLKEVPAAGLYVQAVQPIQTFSTDLGPLLLLVTTPATFELWATSGSVASTTRIAEFVRYFPDTGFIEADPQHMATAGGRVYLIAQDAAHGNELWRTDGTAAGTALVKDINPSGHAWDLWPDAFAVIGSDLYFVPDSDGTTGWDDARENFTLPDLWRSDGTDAGTVKVTHLGTMPEASLVPPFLTPTAVGDRLFLFRGLELWSIPHPGEAPAKVYTFDVSSYEPTGCPLTIGPCSTVHPWGVVGDKLAIVRNRPIEGWESPFDSYQQLLVSDGTTKGTRIVFEAADHNGFGSLDAGRGGNPDTLFFHTVARTNPVGVELYRLSVPVGNPAPAIDPIAPETIAEGSTLATTVTFSDWGADAWSATVDHGDGTTTVLDPFTSPAVISHRYGDDGTFTASVCVTADDGGEACSDFVVTVTNVAPAVSIPVPVPAPSTEGQPVTVTATFADPAGLADAPYGCWVDYGDSTGPVAGAVDGATCTGSAHVYVLYGQYTITVTVADHDGASGSAAVPQQVVFPFRGFLPPVDNPPAINIVKAGAAVPVSFGLGGNRGLAILATGSPTSQRIACTTNGLADPVEGAVTAGASGLRYDAPSGSYRYAWKTDRAWAGTCRVFSLALIDGSTHLALFRLTP